MIGMGVLRILTPKVLKGIMNYVFEENELDMKLEVHDNRIKRLEQIAHAPRDFIVCDSCKKKVESYDKLLNSDI